MIGILYRRFGSSILNFPDLKNIRRDRRLHTHASREIDRISEFIEDRDDGCGLVQAINTTDGFSLDDRCIRDYHLQYKRINYSFGRVTFAKSREI